MSKRVIEYSRARSKAEELKQKGRRIVFTNGVFDIIHVGHVAYLKAAKKLGDVLWVGLNSDHSAKRLGKGRGRPFNCEADRTEVLLSLRPVNYVTIFDEDTPEALIADIAPDVLVKGGDYLVENIAGRESVENRGGEVRVIPYLPGHSTTGTIQRIVETTKADDPKDG